MHNYPSAAFRVHEPLKLWQKTAFRDPPPTELLSLVEEQVRRAIAAQLAATDENQAIQPERVEADVVSAFGEAVRGQAADALARVVRVAVHNIAIVDEPKEITRLLWVWKGNAGNEIDKKRIEEELFRALYLHLYCLAAKKLFGNTRLRHKIDPSDLLSELYIKLTKAEIPHLWENRRQFQAMAATALDNILRDLFKATDRLKRPPSSRATAIKTANHPAAPGTEVDYFDYEKALEELGQIRPRQRDVLELHWLWGLTITEIAEKLGVSETTVKRDERLAKGNLRKLLGIVP